MLKKIPAEAKVGMFTLITLIIIAWATVQVSDRSAVSGGGYDLSFAIETATGLKTKAPVELAGVEVGIVKRIELAKDNRARIVILVNDKVKLPVDSQAVLRTRGFLGESYIELIPGSSRDILQEDNAINQAHRSGDLNTLISEIGDIANDMKTVSGNIRKQAGPDKDAPVNLIIDNLQEFTRAIKEVTVRNTENIDRIAVNLANLTSELGDFIEHSSPHAESAVENMESITAKIDRGEGTFGKLINDDETVNKINSSLDNLNNTLGGFSRLQTEIGFHTEYLSESSDFKNYVSLALKPSPDKALLIRS